MIKKYSFLLGLSLFCFALFSQSNDIKVVDVISPSSSQTYQSVDSFDITIRIQNIGPNILISGDRFDLSYSIEDGTPNSVYIDTALFVGGSRNMNVGEARIYTLATNYQIAGNGSFAVCASIAGTDLYPQNTNKDPGDCVTFVVSLEEQKLEVEKLYYANQAIRLKVNHAEQIQMEVYDITGKLMLTQSIRNQKGEQLIPFDAPSNGFYFIQLIDNRGNSFSSKFAVR